MSGAQAATWPKASTPHSQQTMTYTLMLAAPTRYVRAQLMSPSMLRRRTRFLVKVGTPEQ